MILGRNSLIYYILMNGIFLFFVQISNICLPSILKLQYLEDLTLEGCFGIDDDSLATLKHAHSSLKVFA